MTNSKTNRKQFIYYISGMIALVLLIIFDQWTKMVVVNKLMNKEPFIIVEHIFQFQYLENRGAAFGILQNQRWFFLIACVIILSAIAYVYYKMPPIKKYNFLRVLAVLMAAGAIGNMIDRVANNYVVDFMYFKLINFPIFNVADCYVTVSAALLIIAILFIYKEDDFNFIQKGKAQAPGDVDDTK
ncbi:MAG: signal peptidase II [Lachnotalea sp.]